MRRYFIVLLVLSALASFAIGGAAASASSASGEPPVIAWQHLLGGAGQERGSSLQRTIDGGYVILGQTRSGSGAGIDGTVNGGADLWVVKLDSGGALQWNRRLGGSGDETARCIGQTGDGGYILLADSTSSMSGNVTGANNGETDLWVVRLDGSGEIRWQQLLGGSRVETGAAVRPTTDGGCILFGSTTSSNSGNLTGYYNYGYSDLWFVKLDGAGQMQWQRLLGGNKDEFARDIQPIANGGYVLLAETFSSENGDIPRRNHGQSDLWVVNLNELGWRSGCNLLGGSGFESAGSIEQTPDGGYIVLGSSRPINSSITAADGDVGGTYHGQNDVWIVRLDEGRNLLWQQLLGGSGDDLGHAVRSTGDGEYIVLGESSSNANGDVSGESHGGTDLWTVRLGSTGAVQWDRLFGGSGDEHASAVQPAADGEYVLLGDSDSSASGDVAEMNHGESDLWVVGLKPGAAAPIVAVPNGAGMPTDMDGDSIYDDVNGNGRKDFADVVLYFNQMSWIAANEPMAAFDCNANGRIDFADVVWLFNHL